ncbi:MAG: MarR family transcriptional regulator [Oscillospiraceae bacterium]|nr:MarR family transcriptional regulator [Oscillospiraceae bacterium]
MSDSGRLAERVMRFDALLHRYQFHKLRSQQFGNPHRGQGWILTVLKSKPEISQKELGLLLDMRNQSLGEFLNKLERAGYIVRTPSEEDRRTSTVKLTPEGLAAANSVEDKKVGFRALLDCLTEEEQRNFGDYLERVCANIEAQMQPEEEKLREEMLSHQGKFDGQRENPFGGGFDPAGMMPFGAPNFAGGFPPPPPPHNPHGDNNNNDSDKKEE